MLERINILKIVKDHLRTLRSLNSESNCISLSDCLLFFICPFLIGLYMSYENIDLYDHLSVFITAISVLCGFLFNLLGVIYGLMDKFRADVNKIGADTFEHKLKKTFLNQIHINISFNILVSVCILLLLLFYSYVPKNSCSLIDKTLSATIYFFLIMFFLTLLMILNRVYILMKKDNE